MRFLLGMIFGAFLLFAGVYAYDNHSADLAQRQGNIVNWDVVSDKWSAAKARVQKEWAQLSSR